MIVVNFVDPAQGPYMRSMYWKETRFAGFIISVGEIKTAFRRVTDYQWRDHITGEVLPIEIQRTLTAKEELNKYIEAKNYR